MIKIIKMYDEQTLGLKVDGTLDKNEVKTVLNAVEKKLTNSNKVKLYAEVKNLDIGDITAESLKEDIKFWFRHPGLIPNLTKTALVTDSKWIRNIFFVECALIPTLVGKSFSLAEKNEAITWLGIDQRAQSRLDITYPELVSTSALKFASGFAFGLLASGAIGKKHRKLIGSAIMIGTIVAGLPLGIKILNNNRQLLNK